MPDTAARAEGTPTIRMKMAAKKSAGRRSAFVLCVLMVLPFHDKGWTRGPVRLQPFRPRIVT